MADQELDKLLIKVDSELGDLSGIDEAINALGRLKNVYYDASNGTKQLEAMGKALQHFNGLGKRLKGLDQVTGGINNMIDTLERLSEYTGAAAESIGQLGKLGKALQNFAGLGKSLEGLNEASEGIFSMVNALKELGKVNKDASKGISQLAALGKALHEFDGVVQNMNGIEDVVGALNSLSKVINKFKGTTEDDFKFIGFIADGFGKFNGAEGTYRNIAMLTSSMAKLINVLKDGREIKQGVISSLAGEFKEFNNIKNLNTITNNIKAFTEVLKRLESSAQTAQKGASELTYAFSMAIDGMENISMKIPFLADTFERAGKMLSDSGLLKELEKFKVLNDSYQNSANFVGGIANLIEVLAFVGGKPLKNNAIDSLVQILLDFEKNDFSGAKANIELVGEISDAMARLINALKFAKIDEKDNAIIKLARILENFEDVHANLQGFSYTLYGIRDLITLLDESIGKTISIDTKPIKELLAAFEGADGQTIANAGKGLKQLAPALEKLQRVNADKLMAIAPAIKEITSSIGNMGDNNTLKITIQGDGVAKVKKVVKEITDTWEEFKKKTEQTVAEIDFSRTFKLGDTRRELEKQEVEIKRSLKKQERIIRESQDKLNKIRDLARTTTPMSKEDNATVEMLNSEIEALKDRKDQLLLAVEQNKMIAQDLYHDYGKPQTDMRDMTEEQAARAEKVNEAWSKVARVEASAQKQLASINEQLKTTKEQLDEIVNAANKADESYKNTKNFQSAYHDLQMAKKYSEEYQAVLQKIHVALQTMPTISLKTDIEGMQKLNSLYDERKKTMETLKRLEGPEGKRFKDAYAEVLKNQGRDDYNAEAAARVEAVTAMLQKNLERINSEASAVQEVFDQMERSTEGIAYQCDKVAEALDRAGEQAKKAATASGENFSNFGKLLGGSNNEILKSSGAIFEEIGKHLGKASDVSAKVAGLSNTLGKFATKVGYLKLAVDVIKAIGKEMEKLTATISNAVKAAIQFARTMLTKVVGAFNAVAGAVKKAVSVVQSGCQLMASAAKKLGNVVGSVAKQFSKLGSAAASAMGGIAKSVFKMIPGVGTLLKNSGKSLTQIIKKTSILGGVIKKVGKIIQKLDNLLVKRALLAFLNSLKQSFDDMAVYSSKMGTDFNRNVSLIFSALRRLANQWMAAFEPLLNAATPIILQIIETLRTAGEALAKFMAMLVNQNYYLRARPFYEDYAKGLDKANKAAKNLTNSLDELNILNDTKDDDDGLKPEDMWEKVYFDDKLKFPEINIQDILDWIKDILKNIPWDKIKEKLREWIKKLFDIINQILRDEELWYLIGKTIAEMINTLFEMINEAVHDLDWKALGRAIVNLIKGVLENIDWDLIRDTIKTMFEGLADTLNEIFADKEMWKEIGDTIAHVINDVIVNALDSFAWRFDFSEMMDSILLALITAMENIDWDQIYHAIEGWANGIADAINELFGNERFWLDLANTIANAVNALFYGLENLADKINFEQIGKTLAEAIASMLGSFNWDTIRAAVEKWAKGLAEIINGALSDPTLFANIGQTIGKAISTALAGLQDLVITIDAGTLGQRIGEAIKNAINSIQWDKVFQFPVDILNQIAATINSIWDQIDLGMVGKKLADALKRALKNVNWDDIRKAVERTVANIISFINSVFADEELWKELGRALGETAANIIRIPIRLMWELDYEQIGKDLGLAVKEALSKLDWEDILGGVGHMIGGLVKALIKFLNEIPWSDLGHEIGKGIVKMLNEIDPKEIRSAIYKLITSIGEMISGIFAEMLQNNSFGRLGVMFGNAILGAIRGIGEFLEKNGSQIVAALREFTDALADYIRAHKSEIVEGLNQIIDAICDIVKEFFKDKSKLINEIADIIGKLNLGEILGTIIGVKISEWFDKKLIDFAVIKGVITDFFSGLLKSIWDMVQPHLYELFNSILAKIVGFFAGNALGKIVSKVITQALTKLLTKALGSKIGAAIGTVIGGPIGTIIGGILGLVISEIVEFLLNNLGKIGDVLKKFFNGLGDIIGKIIDLIGGFFGKIGDWFKGLFGKSDKSDSKKDDKKTDDAKVDKNDDTSREKFVISAEDYASLKNCITEAIKAAEPILVTLDDVAIEAIENAIKNALGSAGISSSGNKLYGGNPGVANPYLGGESEGKDTGNGLYDGLESTKDKIDKWGIERAEAILKGYRDKMIINSPSKAMYELGSWSGEGLYNGLKEWIEKLVALIGKLADAILNAVKGLVDAVTGPLNLISGALSGFGSILSGAGEGLANLGEKIGNFLSGKDSTTTTDTIKKDFEEAQKFLNDNTLTLDLTNFSKVFAEELVKAMGEAIEELFKNLDYALIADKLEELFTAISEQIDWSKISNGIIEKLLSSVDVAKVSEDITDLMSLIIAGIDWNRLFNEVLSNMLANVDFSQLNGAMQGGGLRFNAEDMFDTEGFDEQLAEAAERFKQSMAVYEDALNDKDLLDVYARWQFAKPLARAYKDVLDWMEDATDWSLGAILKKFEDFVRRISNLFDQVSKAWDRMFKDMENFTKKGFKRIYNLFKTWIKKIDKLIKSMRNYWKATLNFEGVVKENLEDVVDDFEQLIDDLKPLFDRIAYMWKDTMRKFPTFSKRYLDEVLSAFRKFISKLKTMLSQMRTAFENEFAKLPGIADKFLDEVCKKFETHIQHWKDYIALLAPFFTDQLAYLALIADEKLPLVCEVFRTHMQHIKDMFDDLVAYWEETMAKFPEIADKYLKKVCAAFKKHMAHLKEMFDDLLAHWELTLAKFPEVVDNKIGKAKERFGIHTGDMVKDIDDVGKKWTDTFSNLTPITPSGIEETKKAVTEAASEINNAVDGIKKKWDDTLATFPTTANKELAKVCNEFEKHIGHLKNKLDRLDDMVGDALNVNVTGASKQDVTDAIKDAADDVAQKVADAIKNSGAAQCNCNCNCGDNNGNNNATNNNPPTKDDIKDAIKEAADEVAQKVSDAVKDGTGTNPTKDDIKDAIKDAADDVAQKIADKVEPTDDNKETPTKEDISDAVKDAADDVAQKIADAIKENGSIECNCNCGNKDDKDKDNQDNNNQNNNQNQDNNDQNKDNTPPTKDDIKEAIEEAADEVAQKVADKIAETDDIPNKEDITDAIKDASDEVAQKVADAIKDTGLTGGCNCGEKLDKVIEILGQIADVVKSLKPSENNPSASTDYKDILENIKNILSEIKDAVNKIAPNAAEGSNCGDKLEKLNETLTKILEAVNRIKPSDQQSGSSDGKDYSDVLNSLKTTLTQIKDKMPQSSSSQNGSDYGEKLDHIINTLGTIADHVNNLKPNDSQSSSTATSQDGCNCGEKLDNIANILGQIADVVKENSANGTDDNGSSSGSGSSGPIVPEDVQDELDSLVGYMNEFCENMSGDAYDRGNVKAIYHDLVENIEPCLGLISSNTYAIYELLKRLIANLDISNIGKAIEKALEPLLKEFDKLDSTIGKLNETLNGLDFKVLTTLIETMKEAIRQLKDAVELLKTTLEDTLDKAVRIVQELLDLGKDIIDSITNAVLELKSATDALVKQFKELPAALSQAAKDLVSAANKVADAIARSKAAINSLLSSISDIANALEKAAQKIVNQVIELIKELSDKNFDTLIKSIDDLKAAISALTDKIGNLNFECNCGDVNLNDKDHLTHNTEAKSKNTKAVEANTAAIGALKDAIEKSGACNCNCDGNGEGTWAWATSNAQGGTGGQGGSGGAGGAGGNASINVNLKTIADLLSVIAQEIHNLAEMVKQYGTMLPSTTVAGNTYNIGDLDRDLIEALKQAYTNLEDALDIFDKTSKTVITEARNVINALKIELEKLVSAVTNATTKLETAAKAVETALTKLPKELMEAANKLSLGAQTMTKLIAQCSKNINDAVAKVKTVVDEMNKLVKEIANLDADLTVTVSQDVWKLIDSIDTLEKKLTSYKKALTDMMSELSTGLDALAKGITGLAEEINGILVTFKDTISGLYESANKIATAINDATSKLEGAAKILETGLKDIEKQLNKSFTNLSNAVTNLQKAIEAGESLITQIGEVIDSTITLAASELAVSAEKLIGAMRTIKNDMDYLYSQLFQILQRTEQTLRNTTANLTGAFYDAANRLEQASEKVSANLVNTTNAFVTAAKDIVAAINSVKTVIEWMLNAVSTLSTNMKKLDEHLEKLTTAIDNLATKIADLKNINVHVTCDCNCSCCDKNCSGNNSSNSSSGSGSGSGSASTSSSSSSGSNSGQVTASSSTTSGSSPAMGTGNKSKDATEYSGGSYTIHGDSTGSSQKQEGGYANANDVEIGGWEVKEKSGKTHYEDANGNKIDYEAFKIATNGKRVGKRDEATGTTSYGKNYTMGYQGGDYSPGNMYDPSMDKKTMEEYLQSPEAVTKYRAFRTEVSGPDGQTLHSTSAFTVPPSDENLELIQEGKAKKGNAFWYAFDKEALTDFFRKHGYNSIYAQKLIKNTVGEPSMIAPNEDPMYALETGKYTKLWEGMVNRVKTKGYQMGGMPNSGELFIARENGTPEMVGSIGGHTAVANANNQIVSAVAGGVAQANEAVVNAINNASDNVVTAIDKKDTSVKIGDREIAQANNRGQKQLGRNLMDN